ncbi:MAG: peptidoglycan editing factor PgeF [Croceibacterium sp.]
MGDSRLREEVEVIRAPSLGDIAHGFLGRRGGISTGVAAGLNIGWGAGDERGAVAENRARAVAAVLPGARLVTVYQVHSPDAVVVTTPWPDDERPPADAMVTDQAGMLLGIVTADCAPVLLADADAGVLGAAHAGWRGAHGGVLENTLAAMTGLGARPERIAAVIGPAIAQASYEVADGFRAAFAPGEAHFFAPGRPGHWQFDLAGYVAARLRALGVGAVESLGLDTYPDAERFFSYRRSVHRGEPTYGRQFSLIGLPA